jgi:hypothetical protein
MNDAFGDVNLRTGFYRTDGAAKPALAVWLREAGTRRP